MPLTHLRRGAAGLCACTAAIAFASPVAAEPMNPIPGNGFFLVGPDISRGLYRTAGTGSPWIIRLNTVPTEDSMCVWFTYSTPDANKDNVVETNISLAPMFANINSTVKAFESRNCQPWTRVT